MDPISHAVFGYSVVRASRPAMPRLAVVACIGAIAPDIDAVLMPFGWDIYLRAHDAGTHSLIGTLPVALAVALAVRGRTRAPLGSLFAIAWLTSLSHVALDVLSGARITLAWPFFEGRSLVPLVAMAEPGLIAGFTIGAVSLAFARTRRPAVARCVLSGFAIFLGVKSVWLLQAVRTLGSRDAAPVEVRVVEARWLALREWHVYERSAATLDHLIVAPDRAPILVDSWPRPVADSPLVAQSRQLATVRNLLAVHELTFARERPGERGQTDVLWSDIRFCWTPAAGEEPRAGPLVLGQAQMRISCGLWVGGTYDQEGRALIQRLQVFGRWQTRAIQP